MISTDEPLASQRFRRPIQVAPMLAELWRARALVTTLTERQLRVRYKQAVLGFAWAFLTPVAYLVVFTLFFRRAATVDTAGVPYPLYTYLGLLPWTFFSGSIGQGGVALLNNVTLLNKIYCPREVFTLSAIAAAAIDTLVAAGILVMLFPLTGYRPQPTSFWVLPLSVILVAFTTGVALLLSAVVVYLRDLHHLIPIVLQLGLFATPVAYSIDVVEPRFQGLYAVINPLAPLIDGYRRAVLYNQTPRSSLLVIATLTSAVWLVVGFWSFKRLETGMADVA